METIEAKFYDPSHVPPVELDVVPLENAEGNPVFCRERLPFQTQTWNHQFDIYQTTFSAYFERLYAALTGKEDVPVTMEELRQQVAVLDACYNRPGQYNLI
jgi:hypothetical protein